MVHRIEQVFLYLMCYNLFLCISVFEDKQTSFRNLLSSKPGFFQGNSIFYVFEVSVLIFDLIRYKYIWSLGTDKKCYYISLLCFRESHSSQWHVKSRSTIVFITCYHEKSLKFDLSNLFCVFLKIRFFVQTLSWVPNFFTAFRYFRAGVGLRLQSIVSSTT